MINLVKLQSVFFFFLRSYLRSIVLLLTSKINFQYGANRYSGHFHRYSPT